MGRESDDMGRKSGDMGRESDDMGRDGTKMGRDGTKMGRDGTRWDEMGRDGTKKKETAFYRLLHYIYECLFYILIQFGLKIFINAIIKIINFR